MITAQTGNNSSLGRQSSHHMWPRVYAFSPPLLSTAGPTEHLSAQVSLCTDRGYASDSFCSPPLPRAKNTILSAHLYHSFALSIYLFLLNLSPWDRVHLRKRYNMLSFKGFSCALLNTDAKKHLNWSGQPDSSVTRTQEIEIDADENTITAFAEISPGHLGIEVQGSKDVCSHALMCALTFGLDVSGTNI
jgi:hypothetical protein